MLILKIREISLNSSNEKYDEAYSKIEKYISSSEEIFNDSLTKSDKHQTSLDGIN